MLISRSVLSNWPLLLLTAIITYSIDEPHGLSKNARNNSIETDLGSYVVNAYDAEPKHGFPQGGVNRRIPMTMDELSPNAPEEFKDSDLEDLEALDEDDDEQYYDSVDEITDPLQFEEEQDGGSSAKVGGSGRSMNQHSPTRHEKSDFLRGVMSKPNVMAVIVSVSAILLLAIILLVVFIVYRIRKRDEGSYALKDGNRLNNNCAYSKIPYNEIYA